MTKSHLAIEGMHCGNCANAIRQGLRTLDGVLDADVHHATNDADVTFDEAKVNVAKLLETLTVLGYEAKEVAA
ncbi:MAG: copper chaperone [Rhizobiaceae bacterium]|nr:MAG: copper chaperone [Rhizobiaceae bacterium]